LSTIIEAAGLVAVTVGVAGLAGVWWALVAAGAGAVVYAAALIR
jgi:hypothetical protein